MIANSQGRSGLLVSVRSASEAREALSGGADLIDVKDPSQGPLGLAQPGVIDEVLSVVAGRLHVSAALGELFEWKPQPVPAGIQFVKWGLSNFANNGRTALESLLRWDGPGCPVVVAYADYRRAKSPPPMLLAGLACQLGFSVFLFDTAVKDGTTLLDWIDLGMLKRIRFELGEAQIRVALAGSLGAPEIQALAPLVPDWFAVRGAACEGGRTGRVSSQRVRELSDLISAVQNHGREG
jgi:hypothetical protein